MLAPEAWLSIALVSIAMLGYTGCLANMLSFPADVFPKSAVGSVYGLASMGSGFGGMLFTLITGWVVEHYSYTPVFFGFGVMPLICATILWTLLGPLHPGPAHGGKERRKRGQAEAHTTATAFEFPLLWPGSGRRCRAGGVQLFEPTEGSGNRKNRALVLHETVPGRLRPYLRL